jgi:hypothetical protein
MIIFLETVLRGSTISVLSSESEMDGFSVDKIILKFFNKLELENIKICVNILLFGMKNHVFRKEFIEACVENINSECIVLKWLLLMVERFIEVGQSINQPSRFLREEFKIASSSIDIKKILEIVVSILMYLTETDDVLRYNEFILKWKIIPFCQKILSSSTPSLRMNYYTLVMLNSIVRRNENAVCFFFDLFFYFIIIFFLEK